MAGANAVPSISPFSTMSGPTLVAVMPVTHWSAKLWAEVANSEMDCKMLWAATGIMVFSSK